MDAHRPVVLFIAGIGRSGSTLLDRVLGTLPGIQSLGEVVHLWQRGVVADETCGCGRPFHACSFWESVGTKAFGGWRAIDVPAVEAMKAAVDRTRFVPLLAAPRLGPGFPSKVAAYAEVLGKVYAAAAEVSGASVLVDSSKHVSTACLLRHVPGVDVRVVHLVRDPRGVAYSWTKELERPEAGPGGMMARYSPVRSSLYYLMQNTMLEALALSRTPRLRMRYESFVAEPRTQVSRVLDLVGMPGADLGHIEQAAVELSPNHNIGGNPMKLRSGTTALCRDDAWRTELPAGDRRLVSILTWPLRLGYGYWGAPDHAGRAT
jgi:hypothetical protein